jgi:hypothetical protein
MAGTAGETLLRSFHATFTNLLTRKVPAAGVVAAFGGNRHPVVSPMRP